MTQIATPAEIAAALIADEKNRPDGWSNRERVAFVLSTFGADTIDFEDVFDFGTALDCPDPAIVMAWRQLAVLQATYAETLYIYQWLEEEDYYPIRDHLTAVIQHLDWHIYRLFTGDERELIVIPG